MTPISLSVYAASTFAAGIINVLAGGGSFITFPALLMTGLDARAANITSTIALYPMQISSGFAGRAQAGGTDQISFRTLFIINIIGGAVGALLLLLTPPATFGKLVPWFILFATAVFTWGSFFKKPKPEGATPHHANRWGIFLSQCVIGIYGGYFGAGIGIMMLAALTIAGVAIRKAAASKNVLVGVANTAAVAIFVFSKDVAWIQVGIGIAMSMIGSRIGLRLMNKVDEKLIRMFIIIWGVILSTAFFIYS